MFCRKRWYVKINLQLHAITCPGVWLCTHGYLEATIKTLGYYFRTGAMEPRFPLLCHDQFAMEGYFKSIGSIAELERVLAAEQLDITLWQNGRRLAYFRGKLADVMNSNVPRLLCPHNVNVQLLMKASPSFPGIIAPKVELTVELAVKERLPTQYTSVNGSCGHKSNFNQFMPLNLQQDETRRSNRHCQQQMTLADGNRGCFSYLTEPRRQRPVCHAKIFNGCSNANCPNCQVFDIESISQQKEQERRFSNCSSDWSSLIQLRSRSSDSIQTRGTNVELEAADAHVEQCSLCQLYREAFLCAR